jgi:hypothetical protein
VIIVADLFFVFKGLRSYPVIQQVKFLPYCVKQIMLVGCTRNTFALLPLFHGRDMLAAGFA